MLKGYNTHINPALGRKGDGVGPATCNLRDKDALQRLDDCRLDLVDLITMSELPVFTAAERPHFPIFGDRRSMETTASDLNRSLAEQ